MNRWGQTNWIVACVALFASFSFGQVTTGTIIGMVTDATGAIVPNSNIAVRNVETVSPTVGLITQTLGTPRQVQLALKFEF